MIHTQGKGQRLGGRGARGEGMLGGGVNVWVCGCMETDSKYVT